MEVKDLKENLVNKVLMDLQASLVSMVKTEILVVMEPLAIQAHKALKGTMVLQAPQVMKVPLVLMVLMENLEFQEEMANLGFQVTTGKMAQMDLMAVTVLQELTVNLVNQGLQAKMV